MTKERIPVQCTIQNGKTGRPPMLAKMDVEGIYLWCKVCHTEHRVSRGTLLKAWEELEALEALQPLDVSITVVETKVQCNYRISA